MSRGVRPSDPGREAAYRVLRRIDGGATWRAAWLRTPPPAGLDARGRRFAFEIASGATRLRGRLDARIERHARRAVTGLDGSVRVLLRMGLYQLFETGGVAAHAAVHATVELAKQHAAHASGFVNAVLRQAQRAGPEPPPDARDLAALAATWSHPQWILSRWLERFGFEDTRALCEYDNRRPEICLRVNLLRETRAALLEALPDSRAGTTVDVAVRLARPGYAPARTLVASGLASVQDEGAMLAGLAMTPEPGETLLDVAAAPGGKACQMAERLAGSGLVRAYDRTLGRIERVRHNVSRLGLDNVVAAVGDARRLECEPADAVLVDAPCTGLGVLARRPDLRWRKRPEDLERLPGLQYDMLSGAARLVRPGGRLVYSVCSFEPEETTAVAARFAAAHPEFVADDGGLVLRSGPGISYCLPQRHGMDGGFVARWRRT